jgi:P-type Ca2+ transporter type 2C
MTMSAPASVALQHKAAQRQGLTAAAAAERLSLYGPNSLPEPKTINLWARFVRQFQSALIYVLLLALALDLVLWVHEGAKTFPFEAIAIALTLILNAGLGAYQETKSEAALARLKAMALPAVWALRGGVVTNITVSELVPGDLVRVEAGDRIAADGVLVEGQGVLVDEAVLTGESLLVDKAISDELFSGTLLVRGAGFMEITRTGPASAMGRLATMIGGIDTGKTPLERRLAAFGNQVAMAILALGIGLTVGGVMVEGFGHLGQVVLFSVALAVAAVPEGLPAVLTLTLAMGVERLAKHKAIIKRLSAVEALGSVTVIATDKTGTLTENRMHVHAIDAPDPMRALHAMVLANDAEFATRVGDPLELALLDYAAKRGAVASAIVAARPRFSTRPFDSAAKFMRVTVAEGGHHISYLKGAPEVLIVRSSLTIVEQQEWEAKAAAHASEGYRVLALAWSDDERDDNVEFIGLVMLWDPPRPEVPDAIRRAKFAGIRVIMITGDHPATAEAVGKVVGITTSRVLSGQEIADMSTTDLRVAVKDVNVFARVAPEHKLLLVETLKDLGEIVAVTGDGVNDAPALKRSDIGVAMGQRGSDVAREVADVVLMDDNFATIVTAVEEGRSIYENIQKFIRFFFSTDLALILLMIGGLGLAFFLGMKDPTGATFLLPLTAVQLLWINIVADGPPALALAFDRNPGVMARPPRSPTAQLLDNASLRFIAMSAGVKAVAGLILLGALPRLGVSLEETRTAVFLYESMTQLVFAYPARRIGVRPLPNFWVHLAVWLGIAVQAMTVLVPPLRVLLGLVPLSPANFAIIVAAIFATWAIAEAFGRWVVLNSQQPPKQIE